MPKQKRIIVKNRGCRPPAFDSDIDDAFPVDQVLFNEITAFSVCPTKCACDLDAFA